jgi:large subunit ribosomal protein L10
MTKEEKTVVIAELKEKFTATSYFYITDASGMTVAETNNFRRLCFNKGIEYKVYKNTLIKKALEDMPADYAEFNEKVLKGFSGVLFTNESGKAPAQLLKEYHKSTTAKEKKPVLKGASIDGGAFIGADQLTALLTIKSKQELIGDVLGLLQSPAKNVVSALTSGGGKLAGILKTLSEREGQAA